MNSREGADEQQALALLNGIKGRNARALADLQTLMGRRIYAFSLRLTREVDLANQVVTDTLFDVWRFPERFNGQSKVSTWILAIAKHKALHALRQRHTEHVDLDEIADTIAGDIGDPVSSSLGAERMAALWRCIQRLSQAHRECIHFVFYEGMSLAEVAELQEVPENTVKTRVFHARKKLQACLQGVLD